MKLLGRPIGVWLIVLYIATLTAISVSTLVDLALGGHLRELFGAGVVITSAVLLFLLNHWAVLATASWVGSEAESLWFRAPPLLDSSPDAVVYEISPGIHQFLPLAFAMIVFIYTAWLWRRNALK